MTATNDNAAGELPRPTDARDVIRLCADVIERLGAVATRAAELMPGDPEAYALERRLLAAIATIEGLDDDDDDGPGPLEALGVPPIAVRWLDALAAAAEHGGTAEGITLSLVIAAADGARRPGSWERPWIERLIPLASEPWRFVDCDHDLWPPSPPDTATAQSCRKCGRFFSAADVAEYFRGVEP